MGCSSIQGERHSLQLLGSINLVQCGCVQAPGALWCGPSTCRSWRDLKEGPWPWVLEWESRVEQSLFRGPTEKVGTLLCWWARQKAQVSLGGWGELLPLKLSEPS